MLFLQEVRIEELEGGYLMKIVDLVKELDGLRRDYKRGCDDLPKNYEPKKVIRMLNGVKDKIICVRGNCEAEVDQMVLEFPVLSESLLMFLDNRLIFATHGHIYNKDKLPALQPGDVFLQGHTHIPVLSKIGDNFFMNPGSVSIPKENSEHSYMIYENQSFTLKNLDGKILSDFNLLS